MIRGGRLLDLGALQALLRSGSFDLDQLWLATDKCVNDLQKERWSTSDVLQMLVSLDSTQDYRKSEWCQVSGGHMVPCDVYAMPYDTLGQRRHPRGLEVYLKFSIDETGLLTIALVSCHAS
ncbi:hypothetical protein [Azohydromonas australica]|uniref:hypothetical protein n=1 Tax=Azohydromonas australica TaxID=364039 RepID=UPI00048BE548|nr:hypothetical protein [Azohydromonas australica]